MKIALKTLGCRLNEAELQSWSRGFQSRGLTITGDETQADILVLNTCAVTRDAVRKSRNLIRRCQRNNPQARLVVSGCYASLDQNIQHEIEGIDLLINNQDKDRLVEITSEQLDIPVMPSTATAAAENPLFARNKSRAFIKIQDGCRYRCTFCIVTVARGSERSMPVESIIESVNAASEQGIKEIVLTGVHAGGYGSDINSSLGSLIQRILDETDIPRIRMGSVEPWDLEPDFIHLFENRRFMPHLHLPLQSGSDSVLKRMARRCKTRDFHKLLDQIRSSVPGFNVTTDIIVGFPGETEEEWCESMDFIKSIGFSHIHIFAYSPREGTAAANMEQPVPLDLKRQRSQALHELMYKMKQSALEKQINSSCQVLWESRTVKNGNDFTVSGYTPAYHRVQTTMKPDQVLQNSITETRIDAVSECGETLLGTIVS